MLPDDMDKLSDYIPGSNEVSRLPSRAVSVEEEEEEEDELEDELEEEGDAVMTEVKSAAVLRREGEAADRKAKVSRAKAENEQRESMVSLEYDFELDSHIIS